MSEQAITLQQLSDKLDSLRDITLIGIKEALTFNEAAIFTGFSPAYLYRLTAARQVPHFKKGNRLFFKKSELEHWMLSKKVLTEKEIEGRAESYTHFRKGA